MDQNKALTFKEELFCSEYARLGSPADAARQAGYKHPGRAAAKLLARADIRAEADHRLTTRGHLAAARALAGLERIAFGGIADAVSLLEHREELSRQELATLDLFPVSELKSGKGGGVEMKFYDRLKALELLLAHGVDTSPERHSFYLALAQSAGAVYPNRVGEADALDSDDCGV